MIRPRASRSTLAFVGDPDERSAGSAYIAKLHGLAKAEATLVDLLGLVGARALGCLRRLVGAVVTVLGGVRVDQ